MFGRIEDDVFVPFTVTDTAGGRKLEQVGWLNDKGWYISSRPDYDAEQIERMGYTEPVFRETT